MPPPIVQAVEPSLVCLADGARQVIVRGMDFLTVDGVVPQVSVQGMALTSSTACAQRHR